MSDFDKDDDMKAVQPQRAARHSFDQDMNRAVMEEEDDVFGSEIMHRSATGVVNGKKGGGYRVQHSASEVTADSRQKPSSTTLSNTPRSGASSVPNEEPSDSITVDSTKITFISEKEYKSEKVCWVCKILFGKINERQHHCRLCAHSACNVCSSKRVNDNRVCDICFLKLKNMKGEKRKKKLLAAMKNFIKNLSGNIKKGDKEIIDLKRKKEAVLEASTRSNGDRASQLAVLEAQLKQVESSKNKALEKVSQSEESLLKKRQEKTLHQQQLNDIQMKLNNLRNDIALSESMLTDRENQLIHIRRQKVELEASESFMRLPNFERAKRNDPNKVSEALIFLDSNDLRNGINHYHNVSSGVSNDSERQASSSLTPAGGDDYHTVSSSDVIKHNSRQQPATKKTTTTPQ